MPGKRSVGLLVFTHLPGGELVAILQKRGKFNDETMLPESFPGGCQTTVWGSAKDKENFDEALNREIGEETGWVWTADFLIARAEGKRVIHLEDPNTSGGAVSLWAAYFPIEKIRQMRLSSATGGLEYLREEQIPHIRDLKAEFTRESGVKDADTLAMFDDAKEILKNGFAWAKTLTPTS